MNPLDARGKGGEVGWEKAVKILGLPRLSYRKLPLNTYLLHL